MSENASGKADSCTGNSDNKPSVDCATCGKTFSCSQSRIERSENLYCSQECQHEGLRGRTGEENPNYERVTYDCDNCGKEMERKPSRVENHKWLFCSRDCMYSHEGMRESRSESMEKENVEIKCEVCESVFEVIPSREDKARFCGVDCRRKFMRERSGKEHPLWVEEQEKECDMCGEIYSVNPSLADRSRFCSRECYANWLSDNVVGKDHHLYIENKEENFGENWDRVAEKIREKYNRKCWSCGISESELFRKLDVHHIKPRREFDDISEANTKDNLIPLCLSCHRKWESLPVRPQL